MIAAISWVPKGVAKSVPAVAEPPSKEEIDEILESSAFNVDREDDDYEDDDGDMDVDAVKLADEVAHASAAAEVLGKASNDITDALRELDMENYDNEDDGNFIAVGSMEPSIEIWDLDIIDEVQPCLVLGGVADKKKKRKKVVVILLITSLLGAISLKNLFLAGLPIMFVAFYIYEKEEEAIDRIVSRATVFGYKLKYNVEKIFCSSS